MKKTVLILLACCLLFAFASCEGDADNTPDVRAPTANAGADISIRLPIDSVTLTGSGTDPDDGTLTYIWTYVSGPETYTIASPNTANTEITGLTTAGTYVFQLEVTGSNGNKKTDTVSVVVKPAMTVNPGSPQNTSLQAGGRQITLNGSASTAPDGEIANYEWTCTDYVPVNGVSADGVVAGLNSNGGVISSSGLASADVKLKKAGVYTFALKLTDDEDNVSGVQTVTVTMDPATVNVALASIDLSVGVPTSLDLTPNLGTWQDLISVTLSETDETTGVATSFYNITGNTISIKDNDFVGPSWPPPRITQSFSYKGIEIGSYFFNLYAADMGSGVQFFQLYQVNEGFDAYYRLSIEWTPPAFTINEVMPAMFVNPGSPQNTTLQGDAMVKGDAMVSITTFP